MNKTGWTEEWWLPGLFMRYFYNTHTGHLIKISPGQNDSSFYEKISLLDMEAENAQKIKN